MSGSPVAAGAEPWASIPAMLAAAEFRFGEGAAVRDGDTSLSYAALGAAARTFGAALVASGVEQGDRVAVWCPNCVEWVIALLGILSAGGVLVPVNTRFKGAEAAEILARSDAWALLTVTDFLDTDYVAMLEDTGAALPGLKTLVVVRGPVPRDTEGGRVAASWDEFLALVTPEAHAEVARRVGLLGSDDPSDILFTSGTTGVPKGVVMTHGRTLIVATDWVAMTRLTAGDVYLQVNPYFHMFGLKAGILASVAAGATMLPEPVFDAGRVLDRVEAERVTVLPGAPTVYGAILDHPSRTGRDLSSLRVAVTGAADIPVELIRRVQRELPFSVVITGYGLTEAGTACATSEWDDAEAIATTVGRPRPGFEVRIVDGDSEVEDGEPGEILLRGGSVMARYLDDPPATAAALSADGWLRTGDLGVLDPAGRIRIVGRVKDMFIVGGFNAYPAEIENALLRHPAVLQAAVIGIPDERLGEVGMAFVIVSAPVSGDDLIAWSRQEMANYKVPRVVEVVGALPLNATGKVMKDELRARAERNPFRGGPNVTEVGLSSLRGLRVVELGVWVAAPSAGALLADWGADVMKVEPPSGDPMRRAFGSLGIGTDMPNPAFDQDNRGKRSIVLDLRTSEDRASFETLLATADVFLTNLRPDVLDGLGLEPEATTARHPRLVYCSVSGYGLRGPDRNRPAYDIGAFWARSGLSVQLANSEGVPLNARGGIGDHVSGLAALAGLLAAVLEQRHTGRGRVVEVSLLRTGTYVLGWDLSLQESLGKVAKAEARHANQTPLMNSYQTKDARWFFFTGLEADRHTDAVYRALGREDLHEDPRFANAAALRKHRGEVIAVLDEIVAQRTLAEWADRFDRAGVWWAPAEGPADVLIDPQLAATDGFVELRDADGQTVRRSINGPISFSDVPATGAAPAPRLGAHTAEVLAEVERQD